MFQTDQQIGLYNLVKKIGRGGFGEVWLAERRTEILTTRVAVKLPHREQVNLEAIRQEAALWAKASGHANILPIIEANIYDGQIVIVSEYAPDGSLEEKLGRDGDLPVRQTLETIIGVLSGLDFLHLRQIIHRDIKPANILLQGETPRLADFGISRIIKTTAHSTSIVGTPKYMAPESFDGKRSAATDIWSVGVILYQMLCENLPFAQENPTELMWAIVSKEPAPMPESVPTELRRIVSKALAKLPENRYQTAKEMQRDVQGVLLGISHPIFAQTEVLNNPVQLIDDAPTIDAQTIKNRSAAANTPDYAIPLTEKVDVPHSPAAAYFAAPAVDQNESPANNLVRDISLPLTVPALDSQFQKPPATASEDAETANKQKREFNRAFYFLPLILDLITRIITFNISYTLGYKNDGSINVFVENVINVLSIEFPLEIIVYGILGALFGFIFPGGKWKWGIFLNIGFLFISIFIPSVIFNTGLYNSWGPYTLLAIATTISSGLSSYIAARLSPRNPENAFKSPEEWTGTRKIRGIFYFISPLIGVLLFFIGNEISGFLFTQAIVNYKWPIPSFLLIDTIFTILFILIFFGMAGVLLGYSFPKEKSRWGFWLNLINLFWIIHTYSVIFGRPPDKNFYYQRIGLFLLASAVQNSFQLILPFLASYLGSRLAGRKGKK